MRHLSTNPSAKLISLFHGEALLQVGESATAFFLIQRGSIMVKDRNGLFNIRQYDAGNIFGIPETLSQSTWQNTAVADGPTELLAFGSDRLFETLAGMPDNCQGFIRDMAALAK